LYPLQLARILLRNDNRTERNVMAVTSKSTTTHMALALNGGAVGDVRAFSGLDMQADISENDLGPDGVTGKHVSNISWTPAQASIGLGMGRPMVDWLSQSLAQPLTPASGSVVVGDLNFKAQQAITFLNAVVTSLTVPTLDGASKENGALLVGFEAEQVRVAPGDGSDIRVKAAKAKAWVCSNFRIEIGSLPCARVARVESFSWTSAVAQDDTGIFREPTKHPAKVTVPDLKLAISAVDHAAWLTAAKAWFIDGKHLAGDEMAGRIVLLGPDMKAELAVISFTNMGFRRFQTILGAPGDKIAQFSVTLYAETMSLAVTG
jgi:hypothetical protein